MVFVYAVTWGYRQRQQRWCKIRVIGMLRWCAANTFMGRMRYSETDTCCINKKTGRCFCIALFDVFYGVSVDCISWTYEIGCFDIRPLFCIADQNLLTSRMNGWCDWSNKWNSIAFASIICTKGDKSKNFVKIAEKAFDKLDILLYTNICTSGISAENVRIWQRNRL